MTRKTETVLQVIETRGREGKPLRRIYRELYKPELYELAYSRIYANAGATTKGTGEETLDGMSKKRIDKIIQRSMTETYRWKPARRTYIPKGNGKSRPLGIPSGDDKLLQTAMTILLEAYYEPQFSETSHGFRPGKGCHTALREISQKHADTNWFIEGDIKGCFDNIDHETLIRILGKDVQDGRFLNLVRRLLKAGYMENWQRYNTYSGTPQGGIISPLLANIYLDKLDKWIESELLPEYNRSRYKIGGRGKCSHYQSLVDKRVEAKKEGDREAYRLYGKMMKPLSSVVPNDPKYRKLRYIRYADDFLLSFAGPKSEANEIKRKIREFLLGELKLEMSEEKTLITHARTGKARFLGYDLRIMQSEERKAVNGKVWFGVPAEVVKNSTKRYTKGGKPIHRKELTRDTVYSIIMQYQLEYSGLVQYYQMAYNIEKFAKLRWITETSLLKTLAHKLKMSVVRTSKRYRGRKMVNGKSYKVVQEVVRREGKRPLIATFGAIPLKRNPYPEKLNETDNRKLYGNRTELLKRMDAQVCEMCGESGEIEVHHVNKLKNLHKPGRRQKSAWQKRMIAIRRKTLMTCKGCHQAIHTGVHRKEWDLAEKSLESRVQ